MKRIENKINEIEQLKIENDELIQEVENRIDNEREKLEKIQIKNNEKLSVNEKVNLKTRETECKNNIKNLNQTKNIFLREYAEKRKQKIIELSELRECFFKEENEFSEKKSELLTDVINHAKLYADEQLKKLEKLAKSNHGKNEPLKEKVNSYLKEIEDITLIVSKSSPYSPYNISFTQKQLSARLKELEKTFYKYN